MTRLRRQTDGPALLAQALKRRGLSQLDAEALSGIPQPCFSRYVNRVIRPSAENIVTLWQLFGIPPERWFDLSGGSAWHKRSNGSTARSARRRVARSTGKR